MLLNQHYPTSFASFLLVVSDERRKRNKKEKEKVKVKKKLAWGINYVLIPTKTEEDTISQIRKRRGKMLNDRHKRTS